MNQYQKQSLKDDQKYKDAVAYLMDSSETDKFLGRNVLGKGSTTQGKLKVRTCGIYFDCKY